MKRKPVHVLLGVLALLVIGYAGLRWLRSGGAGASPDAFGLGDLDPERLDSVVMAQPADTVRLVRAGGRWRVGRWPADSARIEDLWRATDEADASELVARSAGNHSRLGVTDSAATHILFYAAGEPRAHLLVGTSGPSWPSVYAREPGADEVYLLTGELSNLARLGAAEWRNRRIARFDPVDVDRVLVVQEADTLILERTDTAWTVAADTAPPVPADSAAVRRAVEGLSRLSSAGFAPDSIIGRLDFANPSARVAVLGADGAILAQVLLVRKEEGRGIYYVRRPAGPDVWELSELSVEDFLKPAAHFRRRDPPSVDPLRAPG